MEALKELLGEELYNQIVAKLGDKKISVVNDGNWFPKEKFDEKNNEVKTLKEAIKTHEAQLVTLQAAAAGNADLQKQITDLQTANKTATEELQKKLDQQAFDFALERELGKAKAKNPKAVKALLDASKIKMDGESLLGLSDQLEALKTSDAYLFDVNQAGGGGNPPLGGGTTKNPWDAATWNLTEQGKLWTSNPTLAAQYSAAAGIK